MGIWQGGNLKAFGGELHSKSSAECTCRLTQYKDSPSDQSIHDKMMWDHVQQSADKKVYK